MLEGHVALASEMLRMTCMQLTSGGSYRDGIMPVSISLPPEPTKYVLQMGDRRLFFLRNTNMLALILSQGLSTLSHIQFVAR